MRDFEAAVALTTTAGPANSVGAPRPSTLANSTG